MIIYPQNIEIKYSPTMKKFFAQKGIDNCKKDTVINIDIFELEKNSKKEILCKCDNCGKDFYKKYNDFVKDEIAIDINKLILKNTYCKNKECINIARKKTCLEKYGVESYFETTTFKNKVKETNLEKYGVENVFQSEEVKNKIKQTHIKKYGVEHALQSKEIQDKMKQHNLEKYNVENVFQSKEIKEKIIHTLSENYGENIINPGQVKEIQDKVKHTNLEKYGVENVFQSNETKKKIKQTCLKKYGVEHHMKNQEIKIKIVNKSFQALYKNGTGVCSTQQKYIHDIIGGELNYPIDGSRFILDIALLDKKIDIEYDGSGHDLGVRMGKNSYEELIQKDRYREIHMKNLGWKTIRIISKKDKLPNEQDLKKLLNKYIDYLLCTKHTWIYINIDEQTIYGNNLNEKINYELKKIKKKH